MKSVERLMLIGAIILTDLRITFAIYIGLASALIFFQGFDSVLYSILYLIAIIPLSLPIIMIVNHIVMRLNLIQEKPNQEHSNER